MLRYTRRNIGYNSKIPPPRGGEIFSWDTWKVRYTNQIRTRYGNWRTTSATQLQPSKSLCYVGYTSTWWQHDCWLTVQTLYAICILTPERISQGHVQNGRRTTFSWPILCKRKVQNAVFILRHSLPDVSSVGVAGGGNGLEWLYCAGEVVSRFRI